MDADTVKDSITRLLGDYDLGKLHDPTLKTSEITEDLWDLVLEDGRTLGELIEGALDA